MNYDMTCDTILLNTYYLTMQRIIIVFLL